MIINTAGIGAQAQFVEFTVGTSTDIHQDYWVVSNVKVPKGTVKGFFISPYGNVTMGNGAVRYAYSSNVTTEKTSGINQADLYYTGTGNVNNIYAYNPSSGTDWEYNAATNEFKFRVRVSGALTAYLSAGTYQLVVW